MDSRAAWHLLILVLLLFASAFFSAAEAAFFSLNFLRVKHLQSRAGPRGHLVASLVVKPRQLIITILMGNELVNTAASSLVGAYLIGIMGAEGRWYAIGLMSFLLLIFGDITPKTLAVTYPQGFAMAAAPFLDSFSRLTAWPNLLIQGLTSRLVSLLGGEREPDLITEDEFKSLVKEGRKLGVLDRDEEDIIYNILELGDLTAADLMVPRTELFALEGGMPLGEVLEIIRGKPFTRIPVYEGDLDHIAGILYVKDLLVARAGRSLMFEAPASTMAKKPFTVHENMMADQLLMEFRGRGVQLALVVDEYGGTAGMITMEDLLGHIFEKIAGIASPHGGLQQKLAAGVWSVAGRMPLADFNQRFGMAFSEEHYNTLGGILLHLFGRLPRRGDVLRSGDYLFTVTSVAEQRIAGVRVEKVGPREMP